MEKKLTEEEIVKALENNLGFGIEHSGMYRICSATLNIIKRLQAENEEIKSIAEYQRRTRDKTLRQRSFRKRTRNRQIWGHLEAEGIQSDKMV